MEFTSMTTKILEISANAKEAYSTFFRFSKYVLVAVASSKEEIACIFISFLAVYVRNFG